MRNRRPKVLRLFVFVCGCIVREVEQPLTHKCTTRRCSEHERQRILCNSATGCTPRWARKVRKNKKSSSHDNEQYKSGWRLQTKGGGGGGKGIVNVPKVAVNGEGARKPAGIAKAAADPRHLLQLAA